LSSFAGIESFNPVVGCSDGSLPGQTHFFSRIAPSRWGEARFLCLPCAAAGLVRSGNTRISEGGLRRHTAAGDGAPSRSRSGRSGGGRRRWVRLILDRDWEPPSMGAEWASILTVGSQYLDSIQDCGPRTTLPLENPRSPLYSVRCTRRRRQRTLGQTIAESLTRIKQQCHDSGVPPCLVPPLWAQ